jgi:hypothetical protein
MVNCWKRSGARSRRRGSPQDHCFDGGKRRKKIDGGPSVVFDAVALLVSDAGAEFLVNESTVRDFVADAFAHPGKPFVNEKFPTRWSLSSRKWSHRRGCTFFNLPRDSASASLDLRRGLFVSGLGDPRHAPVTLACSRSVSCDLAIAACRCEARRLLILSLFLALQLR